MFEPETNRFARIRLEPPEVKPGVPHQWFGKTGELFGIGGGVGIAPYATVRLDGAEKTDYVICSPEWVVRI